MPPLRGAAMTERAHLRAVAPGECPRCGEPLNADPHPDQDACIAALRRRVEGLERRLSALTRRSRELRR